MRKITFSHKYMKLYCMGEWARMGKLVRAVLVNLEDLPKDFLEYDTEYIDEKGEVRHYSLPPKGEYLLLLFCVGHTFLFTTLRSRYGKYGDKKEYYDKMVGKIFDVVIEHGKA